MPAAIPVILAAVGVASEYVLVATVVVGLYEQKRAKQKAQDAYNKSLQDRVTPIRSGVADRSYVIGTVRVSGAIMNIETLGAAKEDLDIILAIANNKCSLVQWHINDDIILANAFPGTKYNNARRKSLTQKFPTVAGPTATLTLPEPPNTIINPVKVTFKQGSTKGTATVTNIVGADVSVSGLPAGNSAVVVTYDTSQGVALFGQFKSGTDTQTVDNWSDNPSTTWTVNHRLLGICHTRNLLQWDDKVWEAGIPNISVVVAGEGRDTYPIYDPRTGSNTTSSTNPALISGWWMTLPRKLGGCGIPTTWIDWQSISVAANICDEIVTLKNLSGTGYTTGKRYECHCTLPTGDSPLVNLETILSAMAGRRAFTGGLYKIVAGAFRPATLTITDADVIGTKPITLSTTSGDDIPPNIVTARFADANASWNETEPKPVKNATYISADGGEKPLDITLPATTDSRRANYLMGVALEGSRPAMTLSLSLGGVGENIALYDTAQFSLTNRSAYAGRTFECVEITDNWDGTFDMVWAEIRPQTWALDPDKYTPTDPVTPGDTSYLWNPPEVLGFAVAAITPQTLPDGTSVSRVTLTWNALPVVGNTFSARVELRYRLAGEDWIGIAPVPADQLGTVLTAALLDTEIYQFQARYVNGVGAASAWLDAWTQIIGTPLPAQLAVRLRADSTIFRVPATGNSVPTVINLAVIRTGLAAAATFTTNPPGITLGGSGDNRTLAYSAMGANESITVTCTITQSSIDYVDVVTILKVHDGADANTTPDPTPPPTPTGLAITSFVNHLQVMWAAPSYSQGHGHDATIVYAAAVTVAQPTPTFANAVTVGSSSSSSFVYSADPGTTWAFWLKHQSRDGYQSTSPAGGTNGLQGTTAKIGNINLGPLIVQAGNLVDGAVTGPKLVSGAVDATKFASGLEPVTIITGALPSSNVGRVVFRTDDQKLYRWNGTSYVSSTAATDIAGQLTDVQLAAIAAAKLTGQISGTQIAPQTISTVNLAAGSVTAAIIAADTITAAQIAAGAITASELAANSVTASAIAANSIVAGKIAAGAISATEIAAGAITASKLAVRGLGAAINPDQYGIDASAWTVVTPTVQFGLPSSSMPGGAVIRLTNGGRINGTNTFPIVAGKRYRVSCWAKQVSGSGPFYFRMFQYDSADVQLTYSLGYEGVTINSFAQRIVGIVDTAPTAVKGFLEVIGSYQATGVVDVSDIRVEEVIPGELIVDGTITARKLIITGSGSALNDDPNTQDASAWPASGAFSIATITDTPGLSTVIRSAANLETDIFSRSFSYDPAKTYRMRCRARSVGANGTFYLLIAVADSSGQNIDHPGSNTYWVYSPSGISLPSSFTAYATKFGAGTSLPFPSNGRTMRIGALMNYLGSSGYHEITDIVVEECVDSGLIVDGAVQATHMAANSIAVGTAAIQNGAIINAMIASAAIDDAKILNLTVNKISGGTLGADIAIGAGRITYDNGVVMRVQGTGFGNASQFVDWFGTRPSGGNINLCTESNATYYLKTNGQAYFGGSISAGIFKNAASTTDTSAAALVQLGPFLTNGNAKTIVVSYQYLHTFNANASTGFVTGSGSATILLEISLNGSSWTLLDTLNVSQTGGTVIVDGDPAVKDQVRFSMSGAHTITNLQGATNNMFLRARITARSLPSMGGTSITNDNVTQTTGFISTE